jgi:hypothetical protein
MKLTFEKSIDILVKAYLNNTLKHGDCSACAVGNLLGCSDWKHLFLTVDSGEDFRQLIAGDGQFIASSIIHGFRVLPLDMTVIEVIEVIQHRLDKASKAIEASGYTVEQLARIENTFELAKGNDEEERMLNGLMAVVDVLAEIHGMDFQKKQEAKEMFVK